MTTVIMLASFFIATATAAGLLLLLHQLTVASAPDTDIVLTRFPADSQIAKHTSIFQRFDHWLLHAIYFSGIPVSLTTTLLLFVLLAFTVCGVVFLLTSKAVPTLLSAVVTILVSLFGVAIWKRRYTTKFQEQFPIALDILSRAVRAGESFEQSMHLLADAKLGQPAEREFQRCCRQLDMGLSISAALASLCQRIHSLDLQVFTSAVSVHRETGGNLGITLERLAAVIRDRVTYRRQLRVATSANRLSVLVIAALGPLLFLWLFFVHPEYGAGLWEDAIGWKLLCYAVVSELVGLLFVAYLLKAEY